MAEWISNKKNSHIMHVARVQFLCMSCPLSYHISLASIAYTRYVQPTVLCSFGWVSVAYPLSSVRGSMSISLIQRNFTENEKWLNNSTVHEIRISCMRIKLPFRSQNRILGFSVVSCLTIEWMRDVCAVTNIDTFHCVRPKCCFDAVVTVVAHFSVECAKIAFTQDFSRVVRRERRFICS